MKNIKLYALIVAISLSGCLSYNEDNGEEYYQLASALTKLSSAVEATVRYENIPDNATSDEIIILATAHDKSLLTPFKDYKVKVQVSDRHAVVLICNVSGTEAYLEDAGCSKELDQHHWKTKAIEACSATLNLAVVCK